MAGGIPFPSEQKSIEKIDQALNSATTSPPEFVLPLLDPNIPPFPLDFNWLVGPDALRSEVTRQLYSSLEVAWSWLEEAPSITQQLMVSIQKTVKTMQPLIACVSTKSDHTVQKTLVQLLAELQYAVDHLTEKPNSSYSDMSQSFEWIANALISLDPALANLEESGSGSCVVVLFMPLAEGIIDGIKAIDPEEVQQFSHNITNNPFFGSGFTLGAQAGILLDARDLIVQVFESVMDPVEAANSLKEAMQLFVDLINELFSPTGADVAREIGRSTVTQFMAKIQSLNKTEGQFMFAFELGKVVGPSIIYTILSMLGFEGFVAERLLSSALGSLEKLKNFSTLTRLLRSLPNLPDPGWERILSADEIDFLNSTKLQSKISNNVALRELEIARKGPSELISEGEYIEQIKLPNGHTWKRKNDETWCRFSEKICILTSCTSTDARLFGGCNR